jgi:hypothetical protein
MVWSLSPLASPSQIQKFRCPNKYIAHPLDLETSLSVIHLVYTESIDTEER